MTSLIGNQKYSITANVGGESKPQKVNDLLLDNRSLMQKELRSLLEENIDSAPFERISELISMLLHDFQLSSKDMKINTFKSLNSNWYLFCKWCEKRSITPIPCTVDNFELYILEQAERVKFNTLKVYSWAVQTMHLAAGLPSPTEPLKIKKMFEKIEGYKLSEGEYTSQASAFNESHLEVLERALSDSHRIIELRDLAILTVAYESMLRESELARMTFEQLSFTRDGRGLLLVPITKSRHSGEPDKVVLSLKCLDAIDKYVEMSGIERTGYVFRKVHKSNKIGKQVKPLSGVAIDKVFSNAFRKMELIAPRLIRGNAPWSGHSARLGACQDLLAAGFSLLEVQVSGRWSSPAMVYRYGRDILAEDSAMAKFRAEKR
ncbi:tyrosine-type recombinase/integrase [Shewanella frigidimarina]|uniref:tyrosine-type recombinase/integrase n=1 Tax=Shewanella frigidimarina TaxID=56812 RepID=UPI003D7A2C69